MSTTASSPAPRDDVLSLSRVTDPPRRRFDLYAEPGTAHSGQLVGTGMIEDLGAGVGELSCEIYTAFRAHGYAVHAARLLVHHAFADLGLARVQAHIEADHPAALRVASRAGLRREGLLRGLRDTYGRHGPGSISGTPDGNAAGATGLTGDTSNRRDLVVVARLVDDPEPGTWPGFVGLVNAALPRKRIIAHAVVRDQQDRVLVCETTYKTDWELPGGVVEPGESPYAGAAREVAEELGVELAIGDLLDLTWLPPWNGWDDALALLYDGGRHDAAQLLARCHLQPREINDAAFCTLSELERRITSSTFERVCRAITSSAPTRA